MSWWLFVSTKRSLAPSKSIPWLTLAMMNGQVTVVLGANVRRRACVPYVAMRGTVGSQEVIGEPLWLKMCRGRHYADRGAGIYEVAGTRGLVGYPEQRAGVDVGCAAHVKFTVPRAGRFPATHREIYIGEHEHRTCFDRNAGCRH